VPAPIPTRPSRLWPVAGILLLTVHVLLLIPDNPVADLGDKKHRDVGTVVAHAVVLAALASFAPWRHRWLDAAFRASPRRRAVVITVAAVVPQLIILVIYARWPRYARVLTEEWGFTEPASVGMYLVTAWLAYQTARVRRAAGLAWKPYHLGLLLCVLLALEEMDYFGLFHAVFGRVGGIYVGSVHDLMKLASHYPATLVLLTAILAAGAAAAWRFGGLSWQFLWEEARSPSTWPIVIGVVATGIAEVVDVKGEVPSILAWLFHRPVEEALEMLGAFLLMCGMLLKYCRDRGRASGRARG
jgi:hypothetical protein